MWMRRKRKNKGKRRWMRKRRPEGGWEKGDDEVNGVNGVEDRDVSLLLDGLRYFFVLFVTPAVSQAGTRKL